MQSAFITCILRLPAEQVTRFQAMAAEECARAAVPQVRRLPLPYLPKPVLCKLKSEVEVDIVCRLVDDLGLLLDEAAARSFKNFVAKDRMVKSSASLRVHCLKRAPAIDIECDEDEDTNETAAVAAVQQLWRLLMKSNVIVSTECENRMWYRFSDWASSNLQLAASYAELHKRAITDWRALRKPSRPRLMKRRSDSSE